MIPACSPSCYDNKILQMIELAPQIYRLRFENQIIANFSKPGQFINIKVSDNYIPFWRRPLSIHSVNKDYGGVDILFRVVGKGTELLSHKKTGESLNFIGPLGQSFDYAEKKTNKALVIAGGLGIAPLLFLCQKLIENQIVPHLFYGVKTETEFCCLEDFEALNIKVYFSTEDGSNGYQGLVTDLVRENLTQLMTGQQPVIFACGPNPMLHQVSLIAREYNLSCQVSLETLMACGVGACLGCGVKVNQPEIAYRYVCKEGPVFNVNEIDLSDRFIS